MTRRPTPTLSAIALALLIALLMTLPKASHAGNDRDYANAPDLKVMCTTSPGELLVNSSTAP